MDQKKTGEFLKTLRTDKGLTQEQAADRFGVSNRTISRWETGANMPDISLLTEIRDFYGVSVSEILRGEFNRRDAEADENKSALLAAEYTHTENLGTVKKINFLMIIGTIACLINLLLTSGAVVPGVWTRAAENFTSGLVLGGFVAALIITSRHAARIKAFKMKIINSLTSKN